MTETVTIPKSMRIAPFFTEKDETIQVENSAHIPFYYVLQQTDVLPENVDETIAQLFREWKEAEAELTALYEVRSKTGIRQKMIVIISNLLTIMFWMNEKQPTELTQLEKEIEELPKKPINSNERMLFILKKPELFHSFVQLKELYVELEKQYSIHKVLQARKK